MTDVRHEARHFTVDAIVEEGMRRSGGLDDLGDGPFLEPLGLFLYSLEEEASLNELGRSVARERALGLDPAAVRRQFKSYTDHDGLVSE